MHGLIRLAFLSHLLGALAIAADPTVDLRLLQTDHKTAGFLEKALEDGKMTSAQIEDKLDDMVKGRTLTELARFKQQSDLNGKVLDFEKDREGIKIADGEVMPGGILIQFEPVVGGSGLVDLRVGFDRNVEKARNKIESERTLASVAVKGDRWEIISDWGNEAQSSLLLARFSGVIPKEGLAASRRLEVRYDSEIRWCEPSDLKKFERSTPATRSKAVTWLIAQSELIATSGLRIGSGQRAAQENRLLWINDENGWDTSQLGWSLEIQSTIGPKAKLIDFQVSSRWHPRDAKRPPSKPEFSYELATTTESGTTLLIEPKARPASGPIPVIFITPTVHIVLDGKDTTFQTNLPKEGELGTVFYPVHPALMRKLDAITQLNPGQNPGNIPHHSPLKNMLESMGLKFPVGTGASFQGAGCQVLLRHDRQGHGLFKAILDQNDLSMPQGE